MSEGRVPGLTEAVARFACDRSVAATVGEGQVEAAARSLVDTLGVALAARDEPAVRAVRGWLGTEPAAGVATVWGEPGSRGATQAALLNGTAAHALDFDDACPSMPLHPSAVLWPALLAVGGESGAEGDPVLLVEALNIGNAVLRSLGEALPMGVHYGRGWHSTATIGRLAAVAALARLRGLNVLATRHALGVAASMAAGSIANFGTGTKPLHAGLAARDAVLAVRLVENGLDAAPDQLEHRLGFLSQFGNPDPAVVERVPERLRHWEEHWAQDWSLKRYPSCYGTHRAVDAALELRPELGQADVGAVDVHVHPGSLRPLIEHLPSGGTEAKFSLPYTLARALRDGRLGVGDFTDAAVAEPVVVELMGRVTVTGAEAPPDRPDLAGTPYARVRVRLADGAEHERLVLVTRGDARNPLADDEVDDKFRAAVSTAGWTAGAVETLLGRVRAALTTPGALADALLALAAAPTTVPEPERSPS